MEGRLGLAVGVRDWDSDDEGGFITIQVLGFTSFLFFSSQKSI
jgi:hypothetical protein